MGSRLPDPGAGAAGGGCLPDIADDDIAPPGEIARVAEAEAALEPTLILMGAPSREDEPDETGENRDVGKDDDSDPPRPGGATPLLRMAASPMGS